QSRTRLVAADVERCAALQVGQCEGAPAVAAVGRAEQREQRRVLRDGKQLACADGPPSGREVEGEHAYLGDEGTCHAITPEWPVRNGTEAGERSDQSQFCEGKVPNSEMMKLIPRIGCRLSCGWLKPVPWMVVEMRVVPAPVPA